MLANYQKFFILVYIYANKNNDSSTEFIVIDSEVVGITLSITLIQS